MMTDINETIQGMYALKTYLASKAIEEHGIAKESLIGMQKVVDSAVNLLKEQEPKNQSGILLARGEVNKMIDSNKKLVGKQKKPSAATWLVFNIGTDLEFAECSNCGAELGKDKYDEYDMPQRCYKCGAQITDVEFPE